MRYFILKDRQVIGTNDLMEWGRWMQTDERLLFADEIHGVRISTVFLGLDHAFGGRPPVLFETMIFGGEHAEEMWRYHTWDEAARGHKKAVKLVRLEFLKLVG